MTKGVGGKNTIDQTDELTQTMWTEDMVSVALRTAVAEEMAQEVEKGRGFSLIEWFVQIAIIVNDRLGYMGARFSTAEAAIFHANFQQSHKVLLRYKGSTVRAGVRLLDLYGERC